MSENLKKLSVTVFHEHLVKGLAPDAGASATARRFAHVLDRLAISYEPEGSPRAKALRALTYDDKLVEIFNSISVKGRERRLYYTGYVFLNEEGFVRKLTIQVDEGAIIENTFTIFA